MLKQANELNNKSNTLGLANRCFLSLIPIATGYAIASTPAQAATLAYSGAEFILSNFSHIPTASSAEAKVNTFTNPAPGSSINTSTEAYSIFIQPNPLGYNTTLSMGIGAGNNYLGTADSKAKVVGNFLVGTNESFKFNFYGNLNLRTSIDSYLTESANAVGNIYFLVLDTTNSQNIGFLDYFLLSGNLSTPGIADYLFAKKSSAVQINNLSKEKDFIGKEESALASVAGLYQRNFSKPTNLTVLEVKDNRTKQQAKSWFSQFNSSTGLNTSVQADTSDSMLVSGATDLSGLETSVGTVTNTPILSEPIVSAMGTETTQLDTAVPTVSQNTIVSTIGNDTLDAQGSYDKSKISSGDIQTAIANNTKAQTWLKGKTQYTALLPNQIVKDVQLFSNVTSGNWVDPPTNYGLEYTVEGDSLITNILDFFTDDADDLFTIAAEGKILGQFSSGDNIDFVSLLGKGVSHFTITDIDPLPGKTLANFNFRPLFNTQTANLQAKSFDKSAAKSIPEPSSAFSLLALGILGVASRCFPKH